MRMMARILIGAAAGGLLGFSYYKLVGCPTGGCPLTRNPWISSLYGMALGALLASSFR
jgi:hypothetical protein